MQTVLSRENVDDAEFVEWRIKEVWEGRNTHVADGVDSDSGRHGIKMWEWGVIERGREWEMGQADLNFLLTRAKKKQSLWPNLPERSSLHMQPTTVKKKKRVVSLQQICVLHRLERSMKYYDGWE